MTTVLARRASFQCVHRYVNPLWDEQRNLETFGLCYNPEGHGHNYTVDAFVEGPVDPETGMVLNLRDLDQYLKEAIQPLADRHLNLDVPDFQTTVPTTENIARFLFARLKNSLAGHAAKLQRVRVYETDDLWVDYFE